MIDWGTILYGAIQSAVIAAFALVIIGERRAPVLGVGTLSALIAPMSWNAILHATHARQFFTDAPIAALPASWHASQARDKSHSPWFQGGNDGYSAAEIYIR